MHRERNSLGRAVDPTTEIGQFQTVALTSQFAGEQPLTRRPVTRAAAQRLLAERFHIDRATLQPTWHQPPSGKRIIPVTPVAADGEPQLH